MLAIPLLPGQVEPQKFPLDPSPLLYSPPSGLPPGLSLILSPLCLSAFNAWKQGSNH